MGWPVFSGSLIIWARISSGRYVLQRNLPSMPCVPRSATMAGELDVSVGHLFSGTLLALIPFVRQQVTK